MHMVKKRFSGKTQLLSVLFVHTKGRSHLEYVFGFFVQNLRKGVFDIEMKVTGFFQDLSVVSSMSLWLLQKIRLFFITWFRILVLCSAYLWHVSSELDAYKAYRRYIHTQGRDITLREFLLSRGHDTSNNHLDNS